MSFFSSIKKSLGISKDKDKNKKDGGSSPSSGNRLGGGAPPVAAPDMYFTVCFTEDKIGMAVSQSVGALSLSAVDVSVLTLPVVSTVVAGAPAATAGVQVRDFVIGLEGNNLSCFEDFQTFLAAIGRPVHVNFARKAPAGAAAPAAAPAAKKSIFSSKPPPPPPLTAEEIAAKRERSRQAALDRTKTWDKKVQTAKSNRNGGEPVKVSLMPDPIITLESESALSAETMQAIERAKQVENQQTAATGFSPFTPHMSFRSTSGGGAAGPMGGGAAAAAAGAGTGGTDFSRNSSAASDTSFGVATSDNIDEAVISEVDDALALLLSMGSSEETEAAAEVAVTTVYKMMSALNNKKDDAKLRSIRVGNPAFQKKVASVPGSIKMLECAGFESARMQKPGAAPGEPEEVFLVHRMQPEGLIRLQYTIDRMNELNMSVVSSPK
jgi:hypothetical protein